MEKNFYKGKFGIWRTVGGRKVFIEDGDDLGTAMFKSGKFNKERYASYSKKYPKVKSIKLQKDEYAMVVHEINTNIKQDKGKYKYYKAIGDYVYLFEYIDFNEYKIYGKLKIK